LNLAERRGVQQRGEGLTMLDVQRWVADPDRHESEIVSLLHESPEPAFESAVLQFIGTNDRTRSSITSTISPTLSWLTHGPARAAARPISQGGRPFDVATLLAENASVFMLGGEEAQVAPLVCALTGHIAREARRLAALQPGGRLDPPLSLRLDEAALICPIPLHQWSADMGGRGVSIVACFQSRAQVIDRYGLAKSATILNNAGARLLFGGTGDRDDLTYWSTLAGDRDEPVTTTDMHGRVASRTTRRVPVLAPAQLANLPRGRVVVFRRDVPPVIGTAEQAWRRLDVRSVHQPDAWTVRSHRRAQRVRDAARRAVAWTTAWLARGLAVVVAWFARGGASVATWWAAMRVRVTGIAPERDGDA
ncbi:MAG: TraM recognition domain-containing protein, partial [Actinomycetia bacterium]|nr:TraM recognition domain-containing protein [Actinomycetes bacterium]